MFVRTIKVKQNNKIYEYPQLVESYRRKSDGMPMQRVVASLKDLSQLQIDNIKAALEAGRKGNTVTVEPKIQLKRPHKPVQANLRYLDVALSLAMWHYWRIPALLTSCLPSQNLDVEIKDIIAALVVQRCVAPGSKLFAERWFPETALPELLAIPLSKFNNNRIHRALIALDKGTGALQNRLPNLYASHNDECAALFLDVTDTWFVGHGPDMAQKAKTKEGMFRRKLGIVLLCNQHGYPLRWEVIPGKRQDGQAMSDMIDLIEGVSWIGDAPLVCDRAMGKATYVKHMAQSGIRFLTALPVSEFDSYSAKIPHVAIRNVPVQGTPSSRKQDLALLSEAALAAGMQKISDQLFVLDLETVENHPPAGSKNKPDVSLPGQKLTDDSCAFRLALARLMRQKLDTGEASSLSHLGKQHGFVKSKVNEIIQLLQLAPDLQEKIEAGHAESLSFTTLRSIRRLPTYREQRIAFNQALDKATRQGAQKKGRKTVGNRNKNKEEASPLRVRGVVYFNPEMCLNQRIFALQRLKKIHAFEHDLNRRLEKSSPQRKEKSVHGEIHMKLKSYDLIEAFDVTVDKRQKDGKRRYIASLKLKKEEWGRRRRYDGFSFLVGHEDLPQSAGELVELYHAKDAVEKDFHVIKSLLQIRPVRHRTNHKVRAHVALCMLALLLTRTLEHRLAIAGHKETAASVFERLSTCDLNMVKVSDELDAFYTVTHCAKEKQRILDMLDLSMLTHDEEVAENITPRY